jgi:hypothetical protein
VVETSASLVLGGVTTKKKKKTTSWVLENNPSTYLTLIRASFALEAKQSRTFNIHAWWRAPIHIHVSLS